MEEENRTFFSRLKPILKQPWFYLVAVLVLYPFCFWPLKRHPGVLYSVLPESLFDRWCEFALLYFETVLFLGQFLMIAICLCFCISRICQGKFIQCAGYLLLTLFFVFCCLPELGVAREKAKRISCGSNLKQLYLAMCLYDDEYGCLPPDLKTLETSGVMTDRRMFLCPSRLYPHSEYSDYEYYGKGRRLKEEKPFLLIEDWAKNHTGKFRNRMYSDGSLER